MEDQGDAVARGIPLIPAKGKGNHMCDLCDAIGDCEAIPMPRRAAAGLIAGHLQEHDRFVMAADTSNLLMVAALLHDTSLSTTCYLDRGTDIVLQIRGSAAPFAAGSVHHAADVDMTLIAILDREPQLIQERIPGMAGWRDDKDIICVGPDGGQGAWVTRLLVESMEAAGGEHAEQAAKIRGVAGDGDLDL